MDDRDEEERDADSGDDSDSGGQKGLDPGRQALCGLCPQTNRVASETKQFVKTRGDTTVYWPDQKADGRSKPLTTFQKLGPEKHPPIANPRFGEELGTYRRT